jgi:hypothetical protein
LNSFFIHKIYLGQAFMHLRVQQSAKAFKFLQYVIILIVLIFLGHPVLNTVLYIYIVNIETLVFKLERSFENPFLIGCQEA